ncbi:hypothetical protein EON81_05115 [bacterium]|nr:MAG: hypothetical protein EON81_05115 [bacterium]
MTRAEAGIALATVFVFGAILIPVTLMVQSRSQSDGQTARMRQIYVGLSLYQADESNRMPPTLYDVRRYLESDRLYTNPKDPWASFPGPYPIDGALPTSEERSPLRISDAYILDFMRAGLVKSFDPSDPRTVLIADPWHGEISIEGRKSFDAKVSGPVFRIVVDGSVRRAERRTERLSDANDLFLSRESTS